ncbi:MAG: zinc-binding alcohol dehydrogenase family protein [Gammaproteobacteria bacterium]|nr:zinc-binding alcohol dehydrogenase family protein [Gammaproteobacteria bacterium]MDH5692271.1 zinc-binding alcohol dehydrogenase family protein [Gammaproteobacteria bacterium]
MKAVGYKKAGPISGPGVLENIEVDIPVAQGRDLLVEVKAISVNPVDTKIRNRVEPDLGGIKVLGWDVAGVVKSVGESVTLFKPGDEVWYAGAIDRPGANSEFHLVDERIVSQKPKSLSFEQAAALPLTSLTAWELIFQRMAIPLESEGNLLIVGGAGGVGSVMIQLAKKLTNLKVIATASRPETIAWVSRLGADAVIDHRDPFSQQLKGFGMDSVEYLVSLTNTQMHLHQYVDILAPQGKLGVIDDPQALDIKPFKTKSISVHWELMYTRSLFQTKDMIEQHNILTRVADMVDNNEIISTFNCNLGKISAENLSEAHKILESGTSIGKLVLSGF